MITLYITLMSLKNDSNQGRCRLSGHDPDLGSNKEYLGSLEEVNLGCYLLDILK